MYLTTCIFTVFTSDIAYWFSPDPAYRALLLFEICRLSQIQFCNTAVYGEMYVLRQTVGLFRPTEKFMETEVMSHTNI